MSAMSASTRAGCVRLRPGGRKETGGRKERRVDQRFHASSIHEAVREPEGTQVEFERRSEGFKLRLWLHLNFQVNV